MGGYVVTSQWRRLPSQRWKFDKWGCLCNQQCGLVLDASRASMFPRLPVLWSRTAAHTQTFTFSPEGMILIREPSGAVWSLVLTAASLEGPQPNHVVQVVPGVSNAAGYHWFIASSADPVFCLPSESYQHLESPFYMESNGKFMETIDPTKPNGRIQMAAFTGLANQQWRYDLQSKTLQCAASQAFYLTFNDAPKQAYVLELGPLAGAKSEWEFRAQDSSANGQGVFMSVAEKNRCVSWDTMSVYCLNWFYCTREAPNPPRPTQKWRYLNVTFFLFNKKI
eukprot:TRINITY_DN23644_c0_g1_i1.p1 TRINITY_DN23644_c0_g1~~TRINITY_DN23644_c0_g1_i1.p1  ORF type:complete len:304 (+),score=58.90 TRINITY_DN23644_c0_g1_i1:74-913(+)